MKRDFDCDSYVPVKGVLAKSCAQYGYNGYCKSTKCTSWCSCGGDASRCDFYTEKWKSKMNTLDMIKQAEIDGKTYQYGSNLFYSFEAGFIDADGKPSEWSDLVSFTLNEILTFQWGVVQTMTRQEAEERLGVKIVG